MANYITTLRTECGRREREVNALRTGLNDLLRHIQSPKFQGPDSQWISTGDVYHIVRAIEAAGTEAYEERDGALPRAAMGG